MYPTGSFNWTVGERCGREGFFPDTISTDLWNGNVAGPAYDLPTCKLTYALVMLLLLLLRLRLRRRRRRRLRLRLRLLVLTCSAAAGGGAAVVLYVRL